MLGVFQKIYQLKANSSIDVARSTSSSYITMPALVVNMDALALPDENRENEGAITASPRIVAGKKSQKRLRVEGSTQHTEDSDLP
ncbi:hypothetical protein PVK06_027793 [Gossypium arboreum]|uniref:Uncharacterized protein n=1 Tax=Gossypium arboreum TaxID=29729 RepID=A0ABR0P3X8_GOSAR|nr:hypothetical protein PVK06_027793 [Gossypium arboreum]